MNRRDAARARFRVRWFRYALVADDWYKRHLLLCHTLYVYLVYKRPTEW